MVADGFTKELTPAKHSEFIKQLNIVDVDDIVKGGLSGLSGLLGLSIAL
jgi:hypothetical protein